MKKGWLTVVIVMGILLSAVAAFYLTRGLNELEAEIVGVAAEQPEVQSFLASYPGSEPHLIKIAPKGIFAIKNGEELDPHFDLYESDPLVGIIESHEFDSPFPDVWIIVYSPEQVRREGYVAPHPPNPAAYVFFDWKRELLFVEVLE